jgi:hypothetical protein
MAVLAVMASLAGCGGSGTTPVTNPTNTNSNQGNGTQGTRSIFGFITDATTSAAISGATVTASGITATTGSDGKYTLNGLPNTGNISITASATGYTSKTETVTSLTQAEQDIPLLPSTVPSPPPPPNFTR